MTASAPENGKAKIVAEYDYCDESRNRVFQVVRFEPGFDGELKTFRQRHQNGDGWKWGLAKCRRILYRLPELVGSVPEQIVFIPEGERDVDNLTAAGCVATTNPMGAGKWKADYSESLRCRHVVILPDNDEPGRNHAADVAKKLAGIAASVTVLELPGLPEKGDVSDWLQTPGNDKAALLKLALEAAKQEQEVHAGMKVQQAEPSTNGAAGKQESKNDTDRGNAERVVHDHGKDLRYCHPFKRWGVWDSIRWREDQTGEVIRRIEDTERRLLRWALDKIKALTEAEKEGDSDDDERAAQLKKLKRIIAHCLRWEGARQISDCEKLMRSEPGIPILPDQLDTDPYLLNLQNGTLDLRTGKLREHRREDFITKLAPVVFDPTAKCALWEKSLLRWMDGNADLAGYLQRVIGYSLTGIVTEHCLWFFHGAGANGKSTFLATILALLGDYGCQAVSDLLLQKCNETHPTERADLHGRRFIATIETDEGKRMAEAIMKQMTGGDKIRARKMRQDFFEFEPRHKIFLAANHKPVIRGTDYAMWRRIKLVPFNVTITEEEKDKNLLEKLKTELPGVLAWGLRGCLQWQQAGLGEPDEVRQATAAYQAEQDTLAGFIASCCFVHREAKCKAGALLDAYTEYTGDKFMTPQAFAKRLEAKGYSSQKGTGGYRWWHGIALTTAEVRNSGA
jgi:putative DNA primase/helicase